MQIDATGCANGIRFIASPNFDERPAGCAISLLVIHNISLPPDEFGGDGVVDLFTNRLDPEAHPYYRAIHGLRVSSHFYIRRTGGDHSIRPVRKTRLARGGVLLAGQGPVQRFFYRYRTRGQRFAPFYRFSIRSAGRTHAGAAKSVFHRAHRGAFRYCTGSQDRPGPLFRLGVLSSSARCPALSLIRAWRSLSAINIRKKNSSCHLDEARAFSLAAAELFPRAFTPSEKIPWLRK